MKETFDSRDIRCKAPFGAVAQGEQVLLSVYPPRLLGVTRAVLVFTCELCGSSGEVALGWNGLSGARDRFSGTLDTRQMTGPVWYRFRFERPDAPAQYLGPPPGCAGGAGVLTDQAQENFQLTVYHEPYAVPAWFGQGVTYQIFMDRFFRVEDGKQPPAGARMHRDWADTPDFLPDENGQITNSDFFGGNLRGVMEKLSYLKSLHVSTLYLSPIFKAASNHRYDTGDYMQIDPLLGDEAQFSQLCEQASRLGMRVLLDGVFNHTGAESRYFNTRGAYGEPGAYESRNSRYYPWYSFENWPEQYSCWWGVRTLPQVNESHPDYMRFIIRDRDSVVRHWLRAGASGWRLDVADELPDEFISALRTSAREEKPDAVLIGEVWEDASNKMSYGKRRRYLLGHELDGVMNYPFRSAVLAYLSGGDAADFARDMEAQRENYPEKAFYSQMNSLGTHDTPRILTLLGSGGEQPPETRQARAAHRLCMDARVRAGELLRVGTAIQFLFPGSPCVYYGDEAGMEGWEDPFNRRGYVWGGEDEALAAYYRRLGRIRAESPAVQSGTIRYLYAKGALLVFERSAGGVRRVLAANRADRPETITLWWPEACAYEYIQGRALTPNGAALTLTVMPRTALVVGG